MAQEAGDSRAPQLLQESLNEEIRMAKFIEDNIDTVTRRYMQLESQGMKSGV
jgi:ferritin-like metal-binding protein YciE